MIELYTWTTPNGRKVTIALEEMGLAYNVHTVNITKDEQFEPAFLQISPNNRIPAIVDADGPDGQPVSVFETGAILLYLAEKTGQFMPTDSRKKIAVYEWLMWQMGAMDRCLAKRIISCAIMVVKHPMPKNATAMKPCAYTVC